MMAFAPMPLRLTTERLLLTPEEEADADWLADLFTTRGAGTVAEIQENLKLIDHKIDVYRHSAAAGEADRLWAPTPKADDR